MPVNANYTPHKKRYTEGEHKQALQLLMLIGALERGINIAYTAWDEKFNAGRQKKGSFS